RVSHHDVFALRVRESGQVGASVAAVRLWDHERSVRGGDLCGAVSRAVVDDDHLAGSAARLDPLASLVDDRADRFLFVQTRDHNGDLHPWRKITALTAVDESTMRAVSTNGRSPPNAGPPVRRAARRDPCASDVHLLGDASQYLRSDSH